MQKNRNDAVGLSILAGLCAVAISMAVQGPASAQDTSSTASIPRQQASAQAATKRSAAAQKSAKRYFIDFRSRSALSYGHTFTVYGKLDAQGRTIESHVAGLHPFTESSIPWTIGHLIPVPSETGASDGDTEDEYITASYRILMNEAEYNKLVAFIKKHQADSPYWHGLLHNCNAWAGEVAAFMGLKTPYSSVLLFPVEYITTLREINGGRRTLDPSFAGSSDATAYAEVPAASAAAPKPSAARAPGAPASAARASSTQRAAPAAAAPSSASAASQSIANASAPANASPPQSIY